jgi:hypothetical protein
MLSDHVRYLEPIQVTGRLTPERCREHERTARELARSTRNLEQRKRLDDIAAMWEQLCEQLEALEKRRA